MRHRKADLELAKRHVVDAEKRVAKQRVLVDALERNGYSTTKRMSCYRSWLTCSIRCGRTLMRLPRTPLDIDSVPPQ